MRLGKTWGVTVIGPAQERREWLLVGVSFAAVYLLGFAGVVWSNPPFTTEHWVQEILNSAYWALLMFSMDGSFVAPESPNIALNIARFLAPFVIMAAVLKFVVRFGFQRTLFDRIRHKTGHTVVCGLGAKGHAIVARCRAGNRDVVVIGNDLAENYKEISNRYGVPILVGDATDPMVLAQAAVGRAAHLVAVSESDAENLEIAVQAQAAACQEQDITWDRIVHIHIGDVRLVQRIRDYDPLRGNLKNYHVDMFSTYSMAARLLYDECPLYEYADLRAQDRVHVVIVGYGSMAESILLQTLHLCHYRDLEIPTVTIIDRVANLQGEELRARYPEAENAADIAFVERDVDTLRSDHGGREFLESIENRAPRGVTAVFVCLPEAEESIRVGLFLRNIVQHERLWRAPPFFVDMEGQSGLTGFLTRASETSEFSKVFHPIGVLEEIYAHTDFAGGDPDAYAKALHSRYQRDNEARMRGEGGEEAVARWRRNPNAHDWPNLQETFREANRRSADHIRVKLASAGYRVLAAPYKMVSPAEFGREEPERVALARLEHERWMADRRLDGWRPGERRDNDRKIHDCLKPFDELSEVIKKYDYQSIDVIRNSVLEAAGMGDAVTVRRDLWIGITGHINLTSEQASWLKDHLAKEVFPKLISEYSEHYYTLVSALAPGADYIFALVGEKEMLQDPARGRLIVPRPVPFEQYLADYSWGDVVTKLDYEEECCGLAERCEWIVDLSPSGMSSAEIAADAGLRDQQYQRLGAYLVERCDVLVAVYDGREIKTGGTGEVLGWSRQPETIPPQVSSLSERQRKQRKGPRTLIHIDPVAQSVTGF